MKLLQSCKGVYGITYRGHNGRLPECCSVVWARTYHSSYTKYLPC